MDKYKEKMQKGWNERKPQTLNPVTKARSKASNIIHRKNSDNGPSHTARPINELTDPSAFAPPPRRTGAGLAPPPPPSAEKRSVIAAPSKYQDPRASRVEPPPKVSHSQQQIEYQQQGQIEYHQQPDEGEQPRGPYRVNTTGLSVDHLPPPPARRDGANSKSPPPPPPSYQKALTHPQQRPVPSLPPRLPPRTNSGSISSTPSAASPAASTNNLLNQGAVTRLGNAGISVPGFGIGKTSPAPSPPPPRQAIVGGSNAQTNELQNRFAKLTAASRDQSPAPQTQPQTSPSQGTTWAQKQAALKTASSFHKDPSSVSLSDAKAAAGTANNFRQRHGEQVAAGMKNANTLNQKYGVANKIGGFIGGGQQQAVGPQQTPVHQPVAAPGLTGKKKPPPPPPKKKPSLGGSPAPIPTPANDAPPPIPLSTRPTF